MKTAPPHADTAGDDGQTGSGNRAGGSVSRFYESGWCRIRGMAAI